MNHTFFLCLLFVVAILSGCASMKHNYAPTVTQRDFPQIHKENTVYVGESMLIQGSLVKHDILKVNATIDGACYDIPRGIYLKTGDDDKKQYFSVVGNGVQVERAGICDPFTGMYVPRDNQSKVCVITIFNGTSCYDGDIEIKNVAIASPDHIQKSIIFSGKKDNEIEFMYVEKSGIQTVHSHVVKYDLSKTDIIGYRGARIKIIASTNESITYVVMKNLPERSAD